MYKLYNNVQYTTNNSFDEEIDNDSDTSPTLKEEKDAIKTLKNFIGMEENSNIQQSMAFKRWTPKISSSH